MTQQLGDNILATLEDGKLVLEIDTSVTLGPSASGKTIMVATTRGNQVVGDVIVGANVYRYTKPKR